MVNVPGKVVAGHLPYHAPVPALAFRCLAESKLSSHGIFFATEITGKYKGRTFSLQDSFRSYA